MSDAITSDAIDQTPEAAEPDTFLSLKGGGTELYFVRHGDALPDQDEVVLGDYDAQALSELGRRQAQALAHRMAIYKPTAIYSSPTGRAAQTAQPTAEALGLSITLDDDLREVELGPIVGDISTNDPAEVSKLLRRRLREIAHIAVSGGQWSVIPGSESRQQLRARVVGAVARIHQRHPGERVAIFSHGGAINAYFADLLGLDRDYFFPAANTSVSVARVQGERRLLMALNDISHLREAGAFEESARMPPE
ncbi:MAG TPA: histidine phosphatase family protein [Ktedonobacterales bacterium]|jgi:broad specificity phosphatase PhoE|nr:histidine phosphatase family protein [Ktedonobacterales bacterium]